MSVSHKNFMSHKLSVRFTNNFSTSNMLETRVILLPILLAFSLFQGSSAAGHGLRQKVLPKGAFRLQQTADFVCPGSDGFYGIPGECSGTYYACVGGTPIQQECPANEVFDPEIKHCVPLAEASCNNGQTTASTTTVSTTTTRTTPTTLSTTPPTISTTTSSTTTTPSGEFTCPAPDGFFPIPGTCDGPYYICVGGVPTLTSCPGETIFDPQTNTCVAPEDASCSETFTCPTSEGFYPIPGTCGSDFYVCVSGSPSISTCPNGNIFDPETLICTSPDQATCSNPFVKESK
ncbi:probable endochitinase isoform X3 [Daphnia pulicaria]|uniref:probable endochitinase isoform X3 n=1 Tax=Daphnia pulicaria TaxID=35523 RepID=UPI001EEA65F5|nr:probable endochitinase isoform X3 [Daphnia pulicaria]